MSDQFSNEIKTLKSILSCNSNSEIIEQASAPLLNANKNLSTNCGTSDYIYNQSPVVTTNEQLVTSNGYYNESITTGYDTRGPTSNSDFLLLDDLLDFTNFLPNDQINPLDNPPFTIEQQPRTQINTPTISDSFMNSLTESNELIYNNESVNGLSNSSIRIEKLSEVKYENMPVFDEFILVDTDKKDAGLAKHAAIASNNKPAAINVNDENEEKLLPWERKQQKSTHHLYYLNSFFY